MTNKLKKKIKRLIRDTEDQLKWKIEYVHASGEAGKIYINLKEKKYTIYLPSGPSYLLAPPLSFPDLLIRWFSSRNSMNRSAIS